MTNLRFVNEDCPAACLRTVPPTAAQCSGAAHRPRLRRRGVPALRTPFGRVLAPPAALRPSIAHCVCSRLQPLRGLQWQRPGRECIFTHSSQSSIHVARKACLWLLLLTGLTSACFRHRRRPPCASSIRNGRPAAPDGLQYSLAHWAYFGLFRALRAAFVRPAKNARNDVHAVISD